MAVKLSNSKQMQVVLNCPVLCMYVNCNYQSGWAQLVGYGMTNFLSFCLVHNNNNISMKIVVCNGCWLKLGQVCSILPALELPPSTVHVANKILRWDQSSGEATPRRKTWSRLKKTFATPEIKFSTSYQYLPVERWDKVSHSIHIDSTMLSHVSVIS